MLQPTILRVGVFYDGGYCQRVSDYYLYHHPRRSRIALGGFQELLRAEIAGRLEVPVARVRIVHAHYHRGRLPRTIATNRDLVMAERAWDEALMHAGIVTHYLPMQVGPSDQLQEKGVDVDLALNAFDLARRDHLDVVVLAAGDGDFIPLVQRLHQSGTAVMVPTFDVDYADERGIDRQIRASARLRAEATWTLDVAGLVDESFRAMDDRLASLFVFRRDPMYADRAVPDAQIDNIAGITPAADLADVGGVDAGGPDQPYASSADDEVALFAGDPAAPSPRWLQGTISALKDAYGFLHSDQLEQPVFFHRSEVRNADFANLRVGMPVQFAVRYGEQGPAAEEMSVLVPIEPKRAVYGVNAPRRVDPLYEQGGYPL